MCGMHVLVCTRKRTRSLTILFKRGDNRVRHVGVGSLRSYELSVSFTIDYHVTISNLKKIGVEALT